MKRFFLYLVAGSCFLFPSVFSQVNLQAIDKYLEQTQEKWEVPSMAVGIIKDGNVVFSKGYGRLEEGKSDVPDGNTLYAVASNSKAFTSAAIAILVQEGKLRWDDPVIKYLPYFEMYNDYVSQNMTIRDLLSHRSGLGTFSGDIIWYRSDLTSEEVVRRVKYLEPSYPFRSGYGYSNVMYVTAGEVIKAVTGKTWSEFIEAHFLKPLEMNRSVTSVTSLEGISNVATPHALKEDKNFPIPWTNWDAVAATGGLISSVNDMAKWVKFNLENGILDGDTILTPESRSLLWTPHNNFVVNQADDDFEGHFRGYGLGWGLSDYHGRLLVGHTGGYDGMITLVQMIPDENLGVIVLTNGMVSPIRAAANYIIDAYLELPEKDWSSEFYARFKTYEKADTRIKDRMDSRVPNTSPSHSLADFSGTYYADIYGNITVSYADNTLKINFEHSPDFSATLSHWHYNVFRINWSTDMPWFTFGTVQFVTNHLNKITELTFDVPNDDIWFHELKAKKKK